MSGLQQTIGLQVRSRTEDRVLGPRLRRLLKVMTRAHTGVLEQYGSGPRIELFVSVWAEERVSVSAKNTPATTNSNIASDDELSVVIAYSSISCKAHWHTYQWTIP